MELPVLPFKIPEVYIPFEIPVLMHPVVDHFAIALPIIVLLLEIINLFIKKRAVGVVSFFLLLLTVIALVAAYLTGLVDGKETFDLLNQSAQADLSSHKLLGIYLILASSIVLLFKLLSAMISRGMMKGLYLFILVLFVVGMLKQGKDGGELVYKHGANTQKVQVLNSEISNLKKEIEELKEKSKAVVAKTVEVVKEEAIEIKKDISNKINSVNESLKESTKEAEEAIAEVIEHKEDNQSVQAVESISKIESKDIPESTKVETTSDTNAS